METLAHVYIDPKHAKQITCPKCGQQVIFYQIDGPYPHTYSCKVCGVYFIICDDKER